MILEGLEFWAHRDEETLDLLSRTFQGLGEGGDRNLKRHRRQPWPRAAQVPSPGVV